MDQSHPLEVNSQTGEPFLRLPTPHNQIIITPPRMNDTGPLVAILNDPRVYYWMSGPPYPYLPEHGKSWLGDQIQQTETIIKDLRKTIEAGEPLKMALGCPVRIIREIKAGQIDRYLGYVSIYRSERQDVLDIDQKQAILAEDARRKVGDGGIVWDIAYYLLPARHGQGIMTAAISALINQWAIPRLNAHIIKASVLQDNRASIKVLEKLGFNLVKAAETREEIRGEMRGVQWLEWTRKDA